MLPPATLKLAPDLRALSLFRIGFALYLLADFAVNLLPDYGDFFSDAGILPRAVLIQDRPLPAIDAALLQFERLGLGALLPIVYPAALIALAAGWRTRGASVFEAYLFWRNPLIKAGAEELAHLLLLWSCFLPLNRHWSLDCARDPRLRTRPVSVLPLIAIRVQIAALYVFAALFKLAGPPWLAGTALAQALADDAYGGRAVGLLLLDHAAPLLPAVNHAVILFQLGFPLLVYCPWRNDLMRGLAIAGAAAMHLAFIVCLNVGGFPYLCLIMLLLLVPDAWIARVPARRDPATPPLGWLTGGIVTRVAQAACGTLAVLMLAGNVAGLTRTVLPGGGGPAGWVELLADTLQVGQRWSLFAPSPSHWHWRFRLVGHDDATAVALGPLPLATTTSAGDAAPSFATHRWLKYFTRMPDFSAADWDALGGYLCRRASALPRPPTRLELGLTTRSVAGAAIQDGVTIRREIQCPSGAVSTVSGSA